MKRVLLFISFLCAFILNVNAKEVINEYDFYKGLEAHGYSVAVVENGYSATKDGVTYTYNIYESNEKALEEFSQYILDGSNINRIAEYNLDNAIADNRNFIAYEISDEDGNLARMRYYYVYRIDNKIIYGTGYTEKKDQIEIMVEKFANNDLEGIRPEGGYTVDKTDAKSDNNSKNIIIVACFSIVLVALLVILCIKKFGKSKKGKSKK